MLCVAGPMYGIETLMACRFGCPPKPGNSKASTYRFFLRAFLAAPRCFFRDFLSLGFGLVADDPGSSGGNSDELNGKPVSSLSIDLPMPNKFGLFIAFAILVAVSSEITLRHLSAYSD